jgi:hypothetical protein
MLPNWFLQLNWIEFVTFRLLILFAVIGFSRWKWSPWYTSMRMWQLGFDKIVGDWPPTPAVGRGEEKQFERTLNTRSGDSALLYVVSENGTIGSLEIPDT